LKVNESDALKKIEDKMKIKRNSKLPAVLDSLMKDRNPNDQANEPRLDDNDPIWQLLAESPRPEPDAWFAVRTMARCRNVVAEGFVFRAVWRWALGGGLGVCLAVVLLMPQPQALSVSAVPDKQKNVQEAFEIMASLDTPDSSSSSSTSSWQDSSL